MARDAGDSILGGLGLSLRLADQPGHQTAKVFYVRPTNTEGIADHQFVWGESGWLPVVGRFGLG
jgi:hypothetical protein